MATHRGDGARRGDQRPREVAADSGGAPAATAAPGGEARLRLPALALLGLRRQGAAAAGRGSAAGGQERRWRPRAVLQRGTAGDGGARRRGTTAIGGGTESKTRERKRRERWEWCGEFGRARAPFIGEQRSGELAV
ncbi:Os08g0259775 [Oryza sativa Japonica Group]|nr:Os08g0259775 [Oryza sativa Japonica Group]